MRIDADGRTLLAAAIVFGVLVGAWMFRYDSYGYSNASHRNRFTGAVCHASEECWFSNGVGY